MGSRHTVPIDIRIVAATNINPELAIEENLLLPDLYYRLNVLLIQMPPLREREMDIIILSESYLKHYCSIYGKRFEPLCPTLKETLINYHWPGNVRELKNLMESAVVVSNGKESVEYDDILTRISLKDRSTDKNLYKLPYKEAKKKLLSDFEREYFTRLLDENRGNISQTSRKAQIDRRSLQRILNNSRRNEPERELVTS